MAAYLEMEASSPDKHEFYDGEVLAMGGGTLNHSIIGNNAGRLLGNCVAEGKLSCIVFNSDIKIYLDKANAFVYPDVAMVCGGLETSVHTQHAIINPILIVEVLSDSTERYDRGRKFRQYCTLPTFKEYVMIDQYQPVVDVLFRENASYWKMQTVTGLDKQIYLHTLDVHIPMAELYWNTVQLNIQGAL